MLLKRRTLLAGFAGVVLLAQPCLLIAKNGDGPGGHDSGHDNGVGNDDGGNDNGVGNDDGGHDNGVGNDDGGDDNGVGNDDGGDDNGVGNDDGGNDNGVGNDDGGDDNDVGNDDGGKDDGGKDDSGRSKKRDDAEWSQDRVLKERQLGRVIPLETALRIVHTKIHGRVIDVDVMVRSGKPQYRVKVRRTDGVIRTVRLDARTGKVIGLLGF